MKKRGKGKQKKTRGTRASKERTSRSPPVGRTRRHLTSLYIECAREGTVKEEKLTIEGRDPEVSTETERPERFPGKGECTVVRHSRGHEKTGGCLVFR